MIVVPSKDLAFDFLSGELLLGWSDDFRGAIFVPEECRNAQMRKEDVGVAVGWHGFIGRTCMITIAVPKPECLTRWVIKEIFRFPFEVCGCNAIVASIDSNNHKSLALCRRSGFEDIHTIEGGGRTGDLVILKMVRDNCRWLSKEH